MRVLKSSLMPGSGCQVGCLAGLTVSDGDASSPSCFCLVLSFPAFSFDFLTFGAARVASVPDWPAASDPAAACVCGSADETRMPIDEDSSRHTNQQRLTLPY